MVGAPSSVFHAWKLDSSESENRRESHLFLLLNGAPSFTLARKLEPSTPTCEPLLTHRKAILSFRPRGTPLFHATCMKFGILPHFYSSRSNGFHVTTSVLNTLMAFMSLRRPRRYMPRRPLPLDLNSFSFATFNVALSRDDTASTDTITLVLVAISHNLSYPASTLFSLETTPSLSLYNLSCTLSCKQLVVPARTPSGYSNILVYTIDTGYIPSLMDLRQIGVSYSYATSLTVPPLSSDSSESENWQESHSSLL